MKKYQIIFLLSILTVFSLAILDRVFTKYPLELFRLALYSILYSLPILLSLFFGEKYLEKNPFSKKIFWKLPLYSIIPSNILLFILLFLPVIFGEVSSEYGMVILFIPFLMLGYTVFYILISLFLSTLYYFKNKIYLVFISVVVVILFLISLIFSIYYISSCGLQGCRDIDHLSQMAMEQNNPSICERALPSDEPISLAPSIVRSKFIVGSISDCYINLAKLEKDIFICERVDLMFRDECFPYFVENNFSIQCEEMKKANSRTICYFEYATILKDENYCLKTEPITKDEPWADYFIETERFTEERCIYLVNPTFKEVKDWLDKLPSQLEPSFDYCYTKDSSSEEREHCIYATAFNKEDPRLCNHLPSDKREKCCNDVFDKFFKQHQIENKIWISNYLDLDSQQKNLCGL